MAHPEVKVQNYKGAVISLLLISGDFKAEFQYAGKTLKGATLAQVRAAIDASIEDIAIPGGLPAYVFDFSMHQRPIPVRVLGVRSHDRGKTFLVERPDGASAYASEVVLPDPAVEKAVREHQEASEASDAANEVLRTKRDALSELRKTLAVGPATAQRLLDFVAGKVEAAT